MEASRRASIDSPSSMMGIDSNAQRVYFIMDDKNRVFMDQVQYSVLKCNVLMKYNSSCMIEIDSWGVTLMVCCNALRYVAVVCCNVLLADF